MPDKLRFFKGAFNYFMNMDISSLEREIAESNNFLARKTLFKNLREQRNHTGLEKRRDVLCLILQLRKGEMTMADFERDVRFFN